VPVHKAAALNWSDINALSLNWVDWVIVVILTLSTLLSLWRGFVREALSLLAWVVAYVAANIFADTLATTLAGVIENVTGRYIVSFVIIFVGVLILGNLVNAVMRRIIKLTGLSTLDRLLGTVFGFTRGLIVVLVVVFIAQELLPMQNQQGILESQIVPHLEMIGYWMRTSFNEINAGLNTAISA
jgi:membrane protein required for colicin V production